MKTRRTVALAANCAAVLSNGAVSWHMWVRACCVELGHSTTSVRSCQGCSSISTCRWLSGLSCDCIGQLRTRLVSIRPFIGCLSV